MQYYSISAKTVSYFCLELFVVRRIEEFRNPTLQNSLTEMKYCIPTPSTLWEMIHVLSILTTVELLILILK